MNATTVKQQWVLDYLAKQLNVYVSPTEIGKAFKKENGLDKSYYDSSDYSGWASPHCKALVSKGLAVRSPKGQYMFVKQADLTTTPPANAGASGVAVATGTTGTPTKSVQQLNEEERLDYNAKNGFIRVAVLSNGLEIYKKQNAAGGWTYFGESNAIFSTLWDSAIGTKEEFAAIAKDLYNMGMQVIVTSVESSGLKRIAPDYRYEIGQLVYYMKNNLVHSARILSRANTENSDLEACTAVQKEAFQRFGPNSTVYSTCHGEFKESEVYPTKEDLFKSL
jgi:hypothetical protein